MGCEKTQEKKIRINYAGMSWTHKGTNQQQSATQRRHEIAIQSSGNLQVSGNKILIIERSKRIQVNFIVSCRTKSSFLIVEKSKKFMIELTLKKKIARNIRSLEVMTLFFFYISS